MLSEPVNRHQQRRSRSHLTAEQQPSLSIALGGNYGTRRFEMFLVGECEVVCAFLTFDQFEAMLKLSKSYLDGDPSILLEAEERDRGRVEVMCHRARRELSAAIAEGATIIKTEGRGKYSLWVNSVFVTPVFHNTRSDFGSIVDEIANHPYLGVFSIPKSAVFLNTRNNEPMNKLDFSATANR